MSSGTDTVFHSKRGQRLRSGAFPQVDADTSIDQTVGQPMTFHDLRHTHVAWLIQTGEHPKVNQTRLGHADIQTALNRYGHLMDGMETAVSAKLEGLWPEKKSHLRLAD